MSRQFVYFLISGGIAALINFCSRVFYNNWFSFSISIVLAYITGMIAAFILVRSFVFKKTQQKLHKSVGFFIIVNLLAVIQTWLITIFLAYYLLPKLNLNIHVKEIAHAFGVIFPVVTSYIGHKHFTFREGS